MVPGTREAFAQALEDWPRVYGFARALVRDAASAEDLCQEAYIHVLERAAALDFDRPLLPLLLKIVRNLAISAHRRRRTESLSHEAKEQVDVRAEDPASAASRGEDREILRGVLAQLPESWSAAIFLKDGLAFSYREIAEVLGASEDTVRTMLHRARRRLAALLSERKSER